MAEGLDFEAAAALGESATFGVAHERAMETGGRNGSKGAVEQDLAGGGGEEVGAADDFGDAHGDVVHDHGEFVGGDVVSVPDEEVAEVAASGFFDAAEVSILESDRFTVGDAEAPVHSGGERVFKGLGGVRAPFGREDGFLLVRGEGGEFLAGMAARINEAGVAEVLPGFKVMRAALALKNGFAVPIEAEPFQILDGGLGEFRFAAVRVEVLDAEENFAAGLAGAAVGGGEGGGVAEVEQARGGRRDTTMVAWSF